MTTTNSFHFKALVSLVSNSISLLCEHTAKIHSIFVKFMPSFISVIHTQYHIFGDSLTTTEPFISLFP